MSNSDALNASHQLRYGDLEAVRKRLNHGQTGAGFAVLYFRDVPSVDPELMGHLALA